MRARPAGSSCGADGDASASRVDGLPPEQAVPVLRRYYELGRVTRPFFDVTLDAPDEAWLAEAPRHPVFRLRPAEGGSQPVVA